MFSSKISVSSIFSITKSFRAAPWVMGCQDRNFILDGEKRLYPEVVFLASYVIDLFMAGRHKGVWRFNPSNGYGKPKPYPTTINDKPKDAALVAPVSSPFGSGLKRSIPSSGILLALLLAYLLISHIFDLGGDC
jgi:hypothetical protein